MSAQTSLAQEIVTKTPAEAELVDFIFTDDLATGETISSPVVTVPAGITAGTPTISGTKVQVLVSSGTAGTIYRLKCQVSTSGGRTVQSYGDVYVENLS